MKAPGETIGQQVYQRETGKETSEKSPPRVRENLKDWLRKPPMLRRPHLIRSDRGVLYARGHCQKQESRGLVDLACGCKTNRDTQINREMIERDSQREPC